MPTTFTHWIKAVVAAFVSGFANAFLSACGITVANTVGITMPQLTPKQLLDIALFGGISGMLLYLKQSPVPQDTTLPNPTPTQTTPPKP